MLLVTAKEMHEIDRKTIEQIGIPGVVLMENAGSYVAQEITKLLKNKKGKIVILSGHGNNGGDGFVIARRLGNSGHEVETWIIGDMEKLSNDSSVNLHSLIHSGYKVKFWSEQNTDNLEESMRLADVIVDAMLGTGVKGELREPYKSITKKANLFNGIRVAVDIPTGVNSDTGEVHEIAFKADITVTFALPKTGQYLYPGAAYVGKLIVADISIPPIVIQDLKINRYLVNREMVGKILSIRNPNSHKGTYGHGLIIGGSKDMPGAPTLAALATMRTGVGLTSIAVPESIKGMVFNRLPEAICIGLPETTKGNILLESIEELSLDKKKYTAIAIGPGMGIYEEGIQWLETVIKTTNLPIVIDADGLNLLANNLPVLLERKGPTVITPHPGEMARLITKDIQYVQQNRMRSASELASKFQIYVVLKGANTIIATPDGEIYVNSTGGPELAKGGTGDVLTGMILSLLSQGLDTRLAVITAVYLHGLSGALATPLSNYSTLATDIIEHIGQAIHETMVIHA